MNATQHSITLNSQTLTFISEEIPKQLYSGNWMWYAASLTRGNDIIYLAGRWVKDAPAEKSINMYSGDGKGRIYINGPSSGGMTYTGYANKTTTGVGDTVVYGFRDTGFEEYELSSDQNQYCLNDIIADGWTLTIDPHTVMRFYDTSNHVVATLNNHVLTVAGGSDIDPHTDPYYHDDRIEEKLLTIENMKQALIDYDTNLMSVIDNKIDAALGVILNASY